MVEINYIGILVSKRTYKKIPRETGGLNKVLTLYEKAAKKNGVTLCYFRVSKIDFKRNIVTALVKEKTGYKSRIITIPKVIYRRTSYRKSYQPHILRLCEKGLKIFNIRRLNHKKYEDHIFMQKNKQIKHHLPETLIATRKTLKIMMKKHHQLMIKPNAGSVGKGIMKLEKFNKGWSLHYKKGSIWKCIDFKKKLPSYLLEKISNGKYIVQEKINLATVNGSPFDLRVAVQKNSTGKWEVTAIIAKLAGENQFLTNIHQGGKSYTLDHLLKGDPLLSPKKVKNEITAFALKIAKYIDSSYSNMADLGLDIGVSVKGFPYLIEINTVSDYFALTMQNNELVTEEWISVFYTPIEYASYLLTQESDNPISV